MLVDNVCRWTSNNRISKKKICCALCSFGIYASTLNHVPARVTLVWLLMTLFQTSNDFTEPLMKGFGSLQRCHGGRRDLGMCVCARQLFPRRNILLFI